MSRPEVSAAELERHLDALAALCPADGVVPPGSQLCTIGRESMLVLAGLRAGLMQIAHPAVAEAVASSGAALHETQARFRRTMSAMYALSFAPTADAFERARLIHRMHARATGTFSESVGRFQAGTRYAANDPEALYWVGATLWDTSVKIYELIHGPLTSAERDAYLSDTRLFLRLFGLEPAEQPQSWAEFQAYMTEMIAGDSLGLGAAGRLLAHQITQPPRPAATPVMAWARHLAAGLLPERLREMFALPTGLTQRLAFAASVRAMRQLIPRLPPSLRFAPAWHRARRRAGLPAGWPALEQVPPRVALWLLQPSARRR